MLTIEAEKLRHKIGIFQACQYISTCYVYWRIAAMKMTDSFPSVQSLKYEDFPIKFVWQANDKVLTPRVREALNPEAIDKMVTIYSTAGDLFYLRLLLKNRTGAISFDKLKTVEGINHIRGRNLPHMKCFFSFFGYFYFHFHLFNIIINSLDSFRS